MSHKPVIGITTRRIVSRSGQKERPGELVPRGYVAGVAESGGLPIGLPTIDPAEAPSFLDLVDGLLLSGGEDVHPALFGEEPHERIDEVDERRDRFEIALAREAHARNLPTFGICRGVQLMNVAFGGTLHQDIPSQLKTGLAHTQRSVEDILWHTVEVAEGSVLARIVGAGALRTNSFHHQACRAVAPGFRVTAQATDGVVEGIEDPSREFFLGVQWHPEIGFVQGDAACRALFAAFVAAAGGAGRASSKGMSPARAGR